MSTARQKFRDHFVITEQARVNRERSYFMKCSIDPKDSKLSTTWSFKIEDAMRFDSELSAEKYMGAFSRIPHFQNSHVRKLCSAGKQVRRKA